VSGTGDLPPAAVPAPDPHLQAGLGGRWQRLHPLSPIVRAGRGLIAIVFVLLIAAVPRGGRGGGGIFPNALGHVVFVAVIFLLALVSWLVTRWRVQDGVLQVETGLIRRTSERFPLTQVQAIDTVRPGLARVFGLTELRIRMASGQGQAGRLAYLTGSEAEVLRAQLLAMSRGLHEGTPEPAATTLLTVPAERLWIAQLLSGFGLVALLGVAVLVTLVVVSPGSVAAASGVLVIYAVFAVSIPFIRFSRYYGLTVAHADDGLRLRSGLIETSAETLPFARIQAIRLTEPVAWRVVGWCRMEVDIASQHAKGHQDRVEGRATRALLPVGTRTEAARLLAAIFPGVTEERLRPPRRAGWKSPLRYPHLSWGSDDGYAVTTSGRLQRVTDWIPLAKVQSIRWVQGPVQRRLRLADIHLDTAGRRVYAVLRDRDAAEAARLMAELPERCRIARRRADELERMRVAGASPFGSG
jgi:putative membrane protein